MKPLASSLILFLIACEAPHSKSTEASQPGVEAMRAEDGMVWTRRAFPTGQRESSELLVERGLPAEVQSGQPYEYEIRLTNLTDMVLTNVVLTDTAPEGFTIPDGAMAAQATNGFATWKVGDIEAGATTTLRAKAMAGTPGAFRHIAQVRYDAPLAGTTMIVQPKLELERRVPELALAVDGIDVRYVVRNAGTGTAREVVIEEPLPEGFTLADGSDTIRIDVGSLKAGEERTIRRKVKAKMPGPFESSAKVSGFGGLAAETARATVRVTTPNLQAEAKWPSRAAIGQVYAVILTLKNDGDGPARDAKASFNLPKGVTLVDNDGEAGAVRAANGVLTWKAGTVEPGGTATLTLRMRAETAAELVFEGTASAYGAEDVVLKAGVEQYGIATVDIEVSDQVDPLQAGSQAVYVVTVRNQGTAAATNLVLVCELEDGLALVEAGGSSKGAAEEMKVRFEPVGELQPKATLTWRIVVTGEKAGDKRFRVALTADQLDRPVEASESTRFFE
ncbi:MAG: hypothetical protein AAGD14_13105 [Planctomycetota bacterium]